MIARSYVPTEELDGIRADNPALAEKIEKLCRATMALRGPAMLMEANGSLTYAAAALAPFITMQDAFEAAMLLKADGEQASRARKQRKTPESEIRKGRLPLNEVSAAAVIRLMPERKPSVSPMLDHDGRAPRHRHGTKA